jgi:hypothetical protein
LLVDEVKSGSLRAVLAESDRDDLDLLRQTACPPAPDDPCIEVYQDRRALPRAYLAPSFAFVPKTPDGWAARRWLAENRRVMLQTPAVELDHADLPKHDGVSVPLPGFRQADSKPLVPAKIVTYTPTEVVIRLEQPRNGVVVLNDAYHPGWKAYVNGEPRPVARVNSVVRGVLVFSGDTEVRFLFENGLRRNVAISLGTLLLMVVFVVFVPLLRNRWTKTRRGFRYHSGPC